MKKEKGNRKRKNEQIKNKNLGKINKQKYIHTKSQNQT